MILQILKVVHDYQDLEVREQLIRRYISSASILLSAALIYFSNNKTILKVTYPFHFKHLPSFLGSNSSLKPAKIHFPNTYLKISNLLIGTTKQLGPSAHFFFTIKTIYVFTY